MIACPIVLFEFSLHICVDELLEAHGAYLITGFECRTIISTGEGWFRV